MPICFGVKNSEKGGEGLIGGSAVPHGLGERGWKLEFSGSLTYRRPSLLPRKHMEVAESDFSLYM